MRSCADRAERIGGDSMGERIGDDELALACGVFTSRSLIVSGSNPQAALHHGCCGAKCLALSMCV